MFSINRFSTMYVQRVSDTKHQKGVPGSSSRENNSKRNRSHGMYVLILPKVRNPGRSIR